MRYGDMTRSGLGAATARITRVVRPWSLPVLAAPVLAFLLVSRSWHGVVAVALAGLAVLAVRGPVVVLGLVPLSLLGAVLPGGTTVTLGAIAAVTLAVAVQVVAGGRRLQRAHLWIALLALLVLVGFVLPAGGSAPEPDRFADLVALLAGLALLAAVTAAPPSPGAVARVTAAAGGIAAAYALAFGERPGGRLEEFGLNPNYLGALLALPFVAGVGLACRDRRPAWLLPAAACFAGMVATQSRGAFVAAVAGVAVMFIQGRGRGVQVLIVTAAVAMGAVFPAALDAAEHVAVGHRQAAELRYDTSVRKQVAWFAVRVAAGHPVRGIGYGTFPSHAGSEFGLHIATHNDYLRLAAETGVPALVAFLVLLWLGLRRPASAGLAVPRSMTAAYAAGLLFANALANLVISAPFWLALGCLLATPRPPLDHNSGPGVQP
jgi:O-antigen ligase